MTLIWTAEASFAINSGHLPQKTAENEFFIGVYPITPKRNAVPDCGRVAIKF
jgi:hypothetical protein